MSFRRTGTTLEPFHPDRASVLVTSGVNAVTRNPMYVGLTGLLAANALRKGSWTAVIPLACFVAVIDRTQIAAEEAALRATFGAEYEAYCAAVPRWVDRRSLAGLTQS
jgi:protein-S-isoprenylcysteine O-methyltransferase Ste14